MLRGVCCCVILQNLIMSRKMLMISTDRVPVETSGLLCRGLAAQNSTDSTQSHSTDRYG